MGASPLLQPLSYSLLELVLASPLTAGGQNGPSTAAMAVGVAMLVALVVVVLMMMRPRR